LNWQFNSEVLNKKNNSIQLNNNSFIADENGFYFRATLVWHTTERESKTISVNNGYIESYRNEKTISINNSGFDIK